MEAREYLDQLEKQQEIILLAHFTEDKCDGRGKALIINSEHRIAIMMQDCGSPEVTHICAGMLVQFIEHPEAEPKIVGSPASVTG